MFGSKRFRKPTIGLLGLAALLASPSVEANQATSETDPASAPLQTDQTSRPATQPSRPRLHSARTRIRPVNPHRAPTLRLRIVKSNQKLQLKLFDTKGRLRPQALKTLREALACARTDEDHPIHWRLVSLLAAVANHWPGRTIEVVSGFRHPKVSRFTQRSNHTRGRAIDFRVQGVSNRTLHDLLKRSFSGIGLGYYPNSSFVHLDIREHNTQWIDYAGPGQAPCYSPTPKQDFADGKVEQLTPAQARQRGCR